MSRSLSSVDGGLRPRRPEFSPWHGEPACLEPPRLGVELCPRNPGVPSLPMPGSCRLCSREPGGDDQRSPGSSFQRRRLGDVLQAAQLLPPQPQLLSLRQRAVALEHSQDKPESRTPRNHKQDQPRWSASSRAPDSQSQVKSSSPSRILSVPGKHWVLLAPVVATSCINTQRMSPRL